MDGCALESINRLCLLYIKGCVKFLDCYPFPQLIVKLTESQPRSPKVVKLFLFHYQLVLCFLNTHPHCRAPLTFAKQRFINIHPQLSHYIGVELTLLMRRVKVKSIGSSNLLLLNSQEAI